MIDNYGNDDGDDDDGGYPASFHSMSLNVLWSVHVRRSQPAVHVYIRNNITFIRVCAPAARLYTNARQLANKSYIQSPEIDSRCGCWLAVFGRKRAFLCLPRAWKPTATVDQQHRSIFHTPLLFSGNY